MSMSRRPTQPPNPQPRRRVVGILLVSTLSLGLTGCPDRNLAFGLDGGETPGAGLPCDVAQLLADKCTSCHRAGSLSAPMSLVTREALLSSTPSDTSTTVIAQSIVRMKDTQFPMPPGETNTPAELAILEQWVTDGTPAGTCDTGVDAGPPGCTSGTHWTGGDEGSKDMNPGQACIACHLTSGEDDWEIPKVVGGTVYPTYREQDDCNGTNGGADRLSIVITDADGFSVTLPVHLSGNFGSSDNLRFPIRAKVVGASGRTREMIKAVDTGDCNSCHTATGANDAPGRIKAPAAQ